MRISSAFSSPRDPRRFEAVADLDALDGVDRHQIGGDVLVELGIDRRAEPGGHIVGHHLDHRADRRARLADAVEILFPDRNDLRIGREERVVCRPPTSPSCRG
jgi:hypothetical protein